MRGKVVDFVAILLVLVLILSPQVIVARGLVQTSKTVTARQAVIIRNPLKPNRPFCNKKKYGSCLPPPPPKPRRRCDKYTCSRGPPPLPTTETQP